MRSDAINELISDLQTENLEPLTTSGFAHELRPMYLLRVPQWEDGHKPLIGRAD